jgi:hypothetical protein
VNHTASIAHVPVNFPISDRYLKQIRKRPPKFEDRSFIGCLALDGRSCGQDSGQITKQMTNGD